MLDSGTPAQFNAYSYGFNNPVTFADPSGMDPKDHQMPGYTSSVPPPSTWWAKAQACKDVACSLSSQVDFSLQIAGGIGEAVGTFLVTICAICQAGIGLGNFMFEVSELVADPTGYWAEKQAQQAAQWEMVASGAWWGAIVSPIVHDWENTPGHVVGTVIGTAATFLIPGGGALKAVTTGARAAEVVAGTAIKVGSAGGETAGLAFSGATRGKALTLNPSTCVYCLGKTSTPQIDHVIPKSRGGNATIENAQTTCPWCNNSKNNRDFPVNPPPGYVGQWPPGHWPVRGLSSE